jgi:hypothetical protein
MFGDYAKAIVIIYASQEALEELGTICVDKFSVFSGEHEVLFNANAKYRVLDSGHVSSTDYRIDKINEFKEEVAAWRRRARRTE